VLWRADDLAVERLDTQRAVHLSWLGRMAAVAFTLAETRCILPIWCVRAAGSCYVRGRRHLNREFVSPAKKLGDVMPLTQCPLVV